MRALIIAAGKGERIAALGDSKPLVELCGRPLIHHVVLTAAVAGIDGFDVVVGYNGDKVRASLTALQRQLKLPIRFIDNPDWVRPNGMSVLAAQEVLKEPFLLLMSDHVLAPSIIEGLMQADLGSDEVLLAVDRRLDDHPLVDLDDVTKVSTEGGRIRDIGKELVVFDAFDTGAFRCTPSLFKALCACTTVRSEVSLSQGIQFMAQHGRARVIDIGDAFWIDVDNHAMLLKAEAHLRRSAVGGPTTRAAKLSLQDTGTDS